MTRSAAGSAPSEQRPIRVLLADDHGVIRDGLGRLISALDGLELVGVAADGAQALEQTLRTEPDVVLMDLEMPVMDGIEATRRILAGPAGAVRVLILTTFGLDDYVYEALRAGASGFMLKDAPPEDLIAGIRLIATGAALLDPAVTRSVIEEFTRRSPRAPAAAPEAPDLTAREHEVLSLLTRGRSNAEIAADLFLTEATVKTHVAHVLMKLGVRDRVQAVIYAYEAGLVTPGAA
jgi:DNA-binding NarL/FixJ family response regulator